MPKVRIQQEDSYDWVFESEEAWETYIKEIETEVSQERINKMISLKEKQNGG